MTEREEFVGLCKRLFGSQVNAARSLGIPIRTVQSWGNEAPMHQPVLRLMRMLDGERTTP